MDGGTTPRGTSIEEWSPTLLLAGGGLLVGHAGMLGVRAYTGLATPPDVFGPAGHLLALAGVLGMYPALVDRTPTATRTAGTVAAVALAGWTVVTVGRLLAVAGLVPSLGELLPGALVALVFVSTILAYALFGGITLGHDDGSRVVGLLLLAPGALLATALGAASVGGVTAVAGTVVGGGLALSTLALGHTVRTRIRGTDRATRTTDVTAG